ncbi:MULTISPECIES: lipase family protein [Streptomyces]|uniref:lipase family protein n=1 Tax=Streptomyces TaxID=1883 RepID=UPI00163BAC57|nr:MULTISPECIES: lipase family protein [Streptomyces]MBC2877329.1 lipase [Streptomyces sp. TYQ1024]UBI38136.1 lipase family protein [Streptomyces mobaraensis]UKW30722.1 lipase family protein [Streptomyces sp. TYQ1024]
MRLRTAAATLTATLALTALPATAVTTATLATAAPTAAETTPQPPTPGDILTTTPTTFHPLPAQPTPTRAWHITYRSTTAKNTPNTVSGTVIVPRDGRPDRTRPLITYAVGTVGLADKCAPSAGFPRGTTVEANLIQLLTARGWAVAVTDYEGLGTPGDHTYVVGRSAGHAVLDAARAALRLPEAGLSPDAPVGIMGYSQGGQATSWAAELHDSYAPELNVKGTATGGVPADLLRTADFNNGGIGAGLILMAASGQNAAYPELRLDDYLNDRGRGYLRFLRENCVAANVAAGLFKKISDVTVRNPLYEADWQRVLRSSNLGTHAPDHPVYLYHGTADELIPYDLGRRLRADWCGRGADVRWTALPLTEHVGGAVVQAIPAANWLAERFADRPDQGNCT